MSNDLAEMDIAEDEPTSSLADLSMDLTSLHFSIDASSNKENGDTLDSTETEERASLFKLAIDKKSNPTAISEEWINFYVLNQKDAVIDLMEFVLEASGCKYKITRDQELPLNWSDVLITATCNFGNKSIHYPLTLRTSGVIESKICQFVQQLLRSVISTRILLDDYFLNNITDFVMVLSDSKVRAFRHTTTLIALKMMTALSGTVLLDNAEIKGIWQKLFVRVYLERSHDAIEDIRLLTVAEFSVWLEQYPECYLQPSDIKYLFGALEDNAPKVCESSFQELFRLYSKTKLRAAFLEQGIKNRMTLLGLTLSNENELGQKAVELLGSLYKISPQIADDNMLQVIEMLVFAAHRGVAQAAADLVPFRYGENNKSEQERLMILIKFFLRVEGQERHCAYFVDAFYGRNDIMLAWNTMIDMLLQPADTLTSQESSVLIEIMCQAIKQAVSGQVPPGRYTEDMLREPLANSMELAKIVVLPHLPALMRHYCGNANDLCNLLELPQYMGLISKAHVDKLLDEIKNIMFEEQPISVLEMGAKTMKHLYSLSYNNDSHCKQLLNKAVSNYMIAATTYAQSSNVSSPKRLLVALSLVSALYACFDMHEYQLIDHFMLIIRQESAPLAAQNLSHYLKIVWLSLSWDLNRLKISSDEVSITNECQALRLRLEDFIGVTSSLIAQNADVNVSCDAFILVCDIFFMFNEELRLSSSADISSLEYQTTVHDYALLEKFLVRYVFADADEDAIMKLQEPEQFTLLTSKRRILSSYIKLAFHYIMPLMRTCIVLQHYRTFQAPFGDIMRSLIERSLLNNATNFGMTLLHTGLLIYERIKATYRDPLEAAASSEISELIQLADMLAERCWLDSNFMAARVSMVVLHKSSIRFAAVNPKYNLLFFGFTEKFVPQLLAQDMLVVHKFLSGYYPEMVSKLEGTKNMALESYRNKLEIAIAKSCRRREWIELQKH